MSWRALRLSSERNSGRASNACRKALGEDANADAYALAVAATIDGSALVA